MKIYDLTIIERSPSCTIAIGNVLVDNIKEIVRCIVDCKENTIFIYDPICKRIHKRALDQHSNIISNMSEVIIQILEKENYLK